MFLVARFLVLGTIGALNLGFSSQKLLKIPLNLVNLSKNKGKIGFNFYISVIIIILIEIGLWEYISFF